MTRRFEGKNAIITGAASGIGAAVVARLAQEGASLACLDINLDGAEANAAGAREHGVDAFALHLDVGDEASIVAAMAESIERLGQVHTLVNMAGVLSCSWTHEETVENFERMLRVNLVGVFVCCRELIPHLLETGGSIVNASSTSALQGHPYFAAYGAAKAGVHMLTNSLAVEYGKKGLRANSIAPGSINTPMVQIDLPEGVDFKLIERLMPIGPTPLGEPEMVADAVAFLASDDARFVNGEILRIDGATLA